MKILVTTLFFVTLGLLGRPLLQAQTTVGTLTCAGSSLSAVVYETEVFTVRVPIADPNPPFGIIGYVVAGSTYVMTDSASSPTLFSAFGAQTVFSSCSIVNGSASVVMTDVSFGGFYLDGVGNGVAGATSPLLFSLGILAYDSVTVGGVTLPVVDTAATRASVAKILAAHAKSFKESFAQRMASH